MSMLMEEVMRDGIVVEEVQERDGRRGTRSAFLADGSHHGEGERDLSGRHDLGRHDSPRTEIISLLQCVNGFTYLVN